MRAKRFSRIFGYVAFVCLAFGLSLYLTFPSETLGRRLVHTFNQQAGGQWALQLEHFSLYRFTGVEATGVTLRRLGAQPVDIPIDRVRARLRLLPLLWAKISVVAEAELGGGMVSAVIEPTTTQAFALQAEARALRLDAPDILGKWSGLPMAGEVVADVVVDWSGDARASDVEVKVSIHGAQVGPGSVAGFTLPSVGLGALSATVALKGGKLELSDFAQHGGDLDTVLSGSSAIRTNLATSGLDACVQFRAKASFLDANPKVKAAMQLAEVRLRKDGEGYLHVPLSGTVAAPRLRGGLCRRGPTRAAPSPTTLRPDVVR